MSSESRGADDRADRPGLGLVESIGSRDSYLAVATTLRADGAPHSSLVNAGLLQHPVSGRQVAAFVTYGARKLSHLRARPVLTLSWRAGWSWVSVDGTAELAGPDDPLPGLDPSRVPELLRDVFAGAGGQHSDWDAYDKVMAEQRRVAVLVTPSRVYSNAR